MHGQHAYVIAHSINAGASDEQQKKLSYIKLLAASHKKLPNIKLHADTTICACALANSSASDKGIDINETSNARSSWPPAHLLNYPCAPNPFNGLSYPLAANQRGQLKFHAINRTSALARLTMDYQLLVASA